MTNKSFLQIALDCISSEWYVFPCKPAGKTPITKHGYLEASKDEKQIREWWGKKTDANVAIACGASNLTVVDCDHGNATLDEATAWMKRSGLPETYTVRTGKRREKNGNPVCGLHLYYSGAMSGSEKFDFAGGSGDIQSNGDYVMAAGSIHPVSGEEYIVLCDIPVAPLPEMIKSLEMKTRRHTPKKREHTQGAAMDAETLEGYRQYLHRYIADHDLNLRDHEKVETNGLWLGIACPFEHASGSLGTESSTVVGFFGKDIVFQCSHGTCEGAGRDTKFFREEMFNREAEMHELMAKTIPLDVLTEPPPEQTMGQSHGRSPDEIPQNGKSESRKNSRFKLEVKPVSEYSPKVYDWLWEEKIALKSTACFVGRGEMGKTFITLSVAAALSHGYDVDEFTRGRIVKSPIQGKTLYITSENEAERVLRPRFDAIGGDSTQLLFANPPFGFTTPERVKALDDAIALHKPLLVVIDPAESYMEDLSPDSRADVRRFVDPMKTLAEKHSCAIVFVRHVRKGSDSTKDFVGDLMSGSAAWRDAVRSVFFAGKTEDGVRAVAVDKTNNTAKQAGALTYTIVSVPLLDERGYQMKDFKDKPATVGKIVWQGAVKDITVEDINRRAVKATETPDQKRQRIILESLPADGSEVPWADIKSRISGTPSDKAASLDALFGAHKVHERNVGMSRFVRRFDPSRDATLFAVEQAQANA